MLNADGTLGSVLGALYDMRMDDLLVSVERVRKIRRTIKPPCQSGSSRPRRDIHPRKVFCDTRFFYPQRPAEASSVVRGTPSKSSKFNDCKIHGHIGRKHMTPVRA